MKHFALALLLSIVTASAPVWAEAEFDVTYWDTADGKVLQSRIPKTADYWQLIPTFAVQITQSYCSVASAITVLNAMPIQKPVDPTYAPYAFFTQTNFFTPEVTKIISPQTVLEMGMTREEMAATLNAQGVSARSVAGDTFDDDDLRTLLQYTLGDDGQFVLANYYRASLGQVGGGHWSALAAYDVETDSVLILDVAKYKYPPVWVGTSTLRTAISTLDTTSNKPRGLVIVSKE
ncbi:MAG: phytochelatin synthase family protein [Gallionella sp.]